MPRPPAGQHRPQPDRCRKNSCRPPAPTRP
jgi:hypothetical protein